MEGTDFPSLATRSSGRLDGLAKLQHSLWLLQDDDDDIPDGATKSNGLLRGGVGTTEADDDDTPDGATPSNGLLHGGIDTTNPSSSGSQDQDDVNTVGGWASAQHTANAKSADDALTIATFSTSSGWGHHSSPSAISDRLEESTSSSSSVGRTSAHTETHSPVANLSPEFTSGDSAWEGYSYYSMDFAGFASVASALAETDDDDMKQ